MCDVTVKSRLQIKLSYPEQPFLKAKQLFVLRNLLHNRVQENTGDSKFHIIFVFHIDIFMVKGSPVSICLLVSDLY